MEESGEVHRNLIQVRKQRIGARNAGWRKVQCHGIRHHAVRQSLAVSGNHIRNHHRGIPGDSPRGKKRLEIRFQFVEQRIIRP